MSENKENLSLLREYLDNDTQQIKEMVALFLEKIPEDVQQLTALSDEKDYENLKKTAHRIKSSVRLFDMQKTADLLQKLETTERRDMEKGLHLDLLKQVSIQMEQSLDNLRTLLVSL
jgi:HPt (histidine-containing phosphotransfer) domain-containing protein